jgi:hypothetical protein
MFLKQILKKRKNSYDLAQRRRVNKNYNIKFIQD